MVLALGVIIVTGASYPAQSVMAKVPPAPTLTPVPASASTPAPAPSATVKPSGNVKVLAWWQDDSTDAWIVHVRLQISTDTWVRLYPPDFVLTTNGGLGDPFKGIRRADPAISPDEDMGVCCITPKKIGPDEQFHHVVDFVIPHNTIDYANFVITWNVHGPDDPVGQ